MEQSEHFGLAFLQVIKDDSQYGEYLSYEEYQSLKAAGTREEFEVFLASTEYRGTQVYRDPRVTYEDLKLVRAICEARKQWWEMGTGIMHLPGLGFLLSPIFALIGWLVSRSTIQEIQKKRAKLLEENALARDG